MKELMKTSELDEHFQEIGKDEKCECCNSTDVCTETVEIKDCVPYKIVGSTSCNACGHTQRFSFDLDKLDYAVEITCDFSGMNKDEVKKNLGRMTFINNKSVIKIYKEHSTSDDTPVVEFFTKDYMIDSIEGILLKIMETYSTMSQQNFDEEMKEAFRKVESMMEGGEPFIMKIVDNSGYSRVCPFGKEYSAMQSEPMEAFDVGGVKHISKPKE